MEGDVVKNWFLMGYVFSCNCFILVKDGCWEGIGLQLFGRKSGNDYKSCNGNRKEKNMGLENVNLMQLVKQNGVVILLFDRVIREMFLFVFKVVVCFLFFVIMMFIYFCGEFGYLDFLFVWYYVFGDYDDFYVCNIIICVVLEFFIFSGEVGEKRGRNLGCFFCIRVESFQFRCNMWRIVVVDYMWCYFYVCSV